MVLDALAAGSFGSGAEPSDDLVAALRERLGGKEEGYRETVSNALLALGFLDDGL